MIDGKKVTAIILIAGNSTRFGQNRNKNFEKINGKFVVSYSLQAFDKNPYIDDMIVGIKEEDRNQIQQILEQEHLTKPTKVVLGGNTRQESACHCIENTNADIVILHDGARPAIKQRYINECMESMKHFKGVAVGVKSKDTIKITDDNGIVVSTTKRSNTWVVQTPQCFDRNVLLEMHQKYKKEEVTDDCMLLEKGNYSVKILEGDYTNIKITTYEDVNTIKQWL